MKSLTFALTVLASTLLSFNRVIASPVAAADGLEARPGPPKPTKCDKTRPTKCSTTSSSSSSSSSPTPTETVCPTCNCVPPAAVTVTRTLTWEDIDGTAASRVPIPDHYNGFSTYNPDQNKVYRSGPPPVSVGDGVQVAYANDGRFGLGAEGFVFIFKSFWILTFLDPDNGITEATIRVSGPLYNGFTTTITADRQFVQIFAPTTQSNTAPAFFIEVFAGPTVGGARLPAWIDDIVYERIFYPPTCCQVALLPQAQTITFSDLPASNVPALTPYRGFNFNDGGWTQSSLVTNDWVYAGTLLKHSAGPGTFTSATGAPFALLRLYIYIAPPTIAPVVGSQYVTWIKIDALDQFGNIIGFGWEIPAVVFGNEIARVDVGGDFTFQSVDPTGFLDASVGEFRNAYGIRISVEERAVGQPTVPREFWIDDLVVVYGGAC